MAGRRLHSICAAVLAGMAMTAASACTGDAMRLACAIDGLEKLPAPLAEPDLCRTFADALAQASGNKVELDRRIGLHDSGAWAQIAVTVRGPHELSARLRHGRGTQAQDLPEAGFSISDRDLGQRQFEQFAQSLARQLTAD